jgi:hypothetical protein
MELRPHSLTAALLTNWYSEFDKKSEISPCLFFPVLYPQWERATPTQKLFRREPAITEFDKLFTPYHKSSDGFVRPTGSGLHDLLQSLHPAHGKLIPLRVVYLRYSRAIHARFHCASVGLPLRQSIDIHSPAHSSIGTPSPHY